MVKRGFKKMTGGTNRLIYRFLEDNSFIFKVASDAVGIGDSPREYINQQIFKPFVTKVFEVSPCGTVGEFERVNPITSREEFLSVAPDIFEAITNIFTGEYVMDDIGSEFFLNWGIRAGFGPVLLDFPYAYKLDGNKLYCNIPSHEDTTQPCGGVIDYDDGYNHLRCTKCGAHYKARELSSNVKNNSVLIKGGRTKMKVTFGYGEGSTVTSDSKKYMDVSPKLVSKKRGEKAKIGDQLKVKVTATEVPVKTKKVQVAGKTVEIPKEENAPGYKAYAGDVTNIKDLIDTDESIKCIALAGKNGYLRNNGEQIVIIDRLCGSPLTDLAILKQEAYQKLIDAMAERNALQEVNKEITREKDEAIENYTSLKTEMDELQAKYDELIQSALNQVNEPKEVEKVEPKRKKTTSSSKAKKAVVKEEPKEEPTETPKEEETAPATEELPDDAVLKETPKEEAPVEDIPVGAAPPTVTKAVRKSMRYDPEFYDKKKKAAKKK
jgi:uncharacterized C2H2 Zn-finger protein